MRPLSFFTILLPGFLCFFGCEIVQEPARPEIDGLTNIYLTMDEDEVDFLRESNTFGDYSQCIYHENGETDVAYIKARGRSSRQNYKRSFTVKIIQENGDEARYALNGSYLDSSCMRNDICLSMYRDLGIPVPATEMTALFLNNHYLGQYMKVGFYEGEDLRNHYSADSLELFKCHFEDLGSDNPLYYRSEKKYPDDNIFDSLVYLIHQYKILDDEEWNIWVGDHFDVENTARYFFTHNFLHVRDTYFMNFYIAVVDGQYLFLPWDNEISMSMADYSTFEPNPLQQRLLQAGSPVRERYDELFTEYIIDDTTIVSNLRVRIDQNYIDMDRAVKEDRYRFYDYEAYLDQQQYLQNFLNLRETQIQTEYGP